MMKSFQICLVSTVLLLSACAGTRKLASCESCGPEFMPIQGDNVCEALDRPGYEVPSSSQLQEFFSRLSERKSGELEQFEASIAELPESDRKLKIHEKYSEEVARAFSEMKCLVAKGLLDERVLTEMEAAFQSIEASPQDPDIHKLSDDDTRASAELNAALDRRFQNNDPRSVYPLRKDNRFKYLDTGLELRNEVFSIVQGATQFLHLSYLQFYPDRMGTATAAALISRKLGYDKPCDIAEVAGILGLPAPTAEAGCGDVALAYAPTRELFAVPSPAQIAEGVIRLKRWFSIKRMQSSGLSINEDGLDAQLIARNQSLDDFVTSNLSPIEVRLFLDKLQVDTFKVEKSGILQALRSFGVEVQVTRTLLKFWGGNHTKIAAHQSRAVISGGNIVDKVMDWDPSVRMWRDAAISVEGGLVNDINHFFLAKFLHEKDAELMDKLCDGRAPCERSSKYFPRSNFDRPGFNASGRLIWTNSFDFRASPTIETLDELIKGAQRSLAFENVFFSDGILARKLKDKAKQWRLADMKKRNGESTSRGTCGPEFFEKVKTRVDKTGMPGTGKSIVLVLAKNMDQPIVKMVEKSLANGLLKAGIDVCRWDPKLDNERNPVSGVRFKDDTMMHSKVYMADDRRVLIGTANLNRRSMKGDIEIGILTDDPKTVFDIRTKMFQNDIRASEPAKYKRINFIHIPLQVLLNYVLQIT